VNIIRQNDNNVVGDVVAGNKLVSNTFNYPPSPVVNELALLYANFKAGEEQNVAAGQICDELQHYFAAKNGSDVRGLKAKLEDSGRPELVEDALELKEAASKIIMKYQSSASAQRIFTLILTEIHTQFDLLVTPLIQADASRTEVDKTVYQILQATFAGLGENALKLNVRQMFALLYFLGGNCHIRWDKKC
jgi:hypothetical protein